MWVAEGEKYAFIGLEVRTEGGIPQGEVLPGLWCWTDPRFDVPQEWQRAVGSFRAQQLARNNNLFLCKKTHSATSAVLDDENRSLQRGVKHFYVGLLLSSAFSPASRPMMVTGYRLDHVPHIREHTNLRLPMPQDASKPPAVVAADIQAAARLGQRLDAMESARVPGGLLRLFRTLRVYADARTHREPLDRIHQYCRCLDGMILPEPGRATKQFKSRTELFVGPKHHDLMGGLYEIRSHVEHLHEHRHLDASSGDTLPDVVRKAAIVEAIVRRALATIIGREELWEHFANAETLSSFWALSPEDRHSLWGEPVPPAGHS